MSHNHGTAYTIWFSGAVCLVCSIFVCLSAVMLKDRQEVNRQLDKQKNVLLAAGLARGDEELSNADVQQRFASIRPVVVELKIGRELPDVDASTFDMRGAQADEATSSRAPDNPAKVLRVPHNGIVYQVMEGGRTVKLVLPVSGKGLWSTLHGFLAIDADTTTVKGVSFYEHSETPGLGGEVENPNWTAGWVGRRLFDDNWLPVFQVKKGTAGSAAEDPHHVDGLSGATLTCKGVTALVNFWIGENGYGPYLKNFREGGK
mgnify:CR=1 FL=1